uniref:Uncharacterized protein n=1 Tax=Arundo donax TaxID=35708 RepID=A0A0A9A917_ARUDO
MIASLTALDPAWLHHGAASGDS